MSEKIPNHYWTFHKYYLFFLKGHLSQWWPSFFVYRGEEYNCAEQFMMHQKALLFGDVKTADFIIRSSDPSVHKFAGRKVQDFNSKTWDSVKYQLVLLGNILKFSQNPNLLEILIKTDPYTLVETNPEDSIWGIGLAANDPLTINEETWKGENLLGRVLMDTRSILKK